MMHVIRHECVALLRTRALWLYLAVFGGLLVVAARSGEAWRDGVYAGRAAAADAQHRSLAAAAKLPEQPWAVPWMTLGRVPVTAELPMGSLAPVAIDRVGQYRSSVVLDIRPPDPSDGEARMLSPFLLDIGAFDLAMVVVVLFPLGLVAMAHDLWVAERVRGTLALVEVCAPSTTRWILATILGRWLALVAPIVVVVAAVIAWWGPATTEAAVLLGAVAVYGLLWLIICAGIGSRAPSAAWSATAALAVWIGLVVLVPAAAGVAASTLVKVPSAVELEVELERDSLDAEEAGEALMESYLDEHPELPRPTRDEDPKGWAKPYLLVLQAEAARRGAVLDTLERRLATQREVAAVASAVSPAATMQAVVATLAGHDEERLAEYRGAVVELRRRRRDALVERVLQARPFDANDPALTTAAMDIAVPRGLHTTVPGLVLLLGQCVVAAAVSWWALRAPA